MKQRGKKSIFFKNFEILSKTCWDTLYYMAAEILTLEWIGIRRSTKELQKRKHRNFVVKRPKMQKFAFALGIDNPYLVPKGHQNSIEALVLIQYLKCHLKEGLSKISSSFKTISQCRNPPKLVPKYFGAQKLSASNLDTDDEEGVRRNC